LAFLVVVLAPFFIEVFLVIYRHELNVNILLEVPPFAYVEPNIGVFLSTVIWSYGGFDSMGNLAGEVKGGRKTFLLGILGSFPLVFLNYFFPIFVGYSINPVYQDWQTGYFTNIAYMVTTKGQWLGIFMVIASAISNFGQFNAAMAPMARVVWSCAKMGYLPSFIGWSWQRHTGTIRPIAAVIFTGVTTTILTGIPYNALVQAFLVIRIFNLICEYAALIRLRYTEPDTERPFIVSGGMPMAWLLGVPTVLLSGYAIYSAGWQTWVAGAAVNAFSVVCFFIRWLVYKKWPPSTQDMNINILPEEDD